MLVKKRVGSTMLALVLGNEVGMAYLFLFSRGSHTVERMHYTKAPQMSK